MIEKEILSELCVRGLQTRGLLSDERYRNRLRREMKAIDQQGEHQYFIDLYHKFRENKIIFPYNENNLLVAWLLGLAKDFDIDQEPVTIIGEMPDIDVDFIRDVRDYLKREWAPKKFGREFICEIGTYGTSGIKASILDMTRVHGLNVHEAQDITVKIKDKFSDDEGNTQELKWDDALKIYKELKEFCDKYPEVAEAALMIQDRIKTGGVHAGGLIISSVPIDGFVPLEVRMINEDNPNGVVCSAWPEGLNAQDLQPVGLIKFDLLVVNNLLQIAIACDLVKKRHGLSAISALPGSWDWSDLSYLNDAKAIKMANDGDLRCIFQFDSEGMRKLIKRGGVTSFDDLAVYSALYRPGPLNQGMGDRYCKRKRGEEPWGVHPLLQPILGKTYGVMVYQEQVMDMLRVVGNIPDMHTEKVRKAISKKKVAQFIKYKDMFIENGMNNLQVNRDFCEDLWAQIESFAEYGFNKSHAYAYTYISSRLLYLKAHYPLEFYTAILMCEKDHAKFRDYKLDAKYHGVTISPVHINKSKENFHIDDGKIYFGFSNVNGIGDVAKQIVENQPYRDFTDFLNRFGTDAKVIKALTALGVFNERHDRLTLRKFAEFYKDGSKKRRDRQTRFRTNIDKRFNELRELLLSEISEDDPDFEMMCNFNDEAEAKWEERFSHIVRTVEYRSKIKEIPLSKLLQDLYRKYSSSVKNFDDKESNDDDSPITIDQFNSASIKLDDEEVEILTDELDVNGEITYPKAERKYYGFQWTHVLESCVGYQGNTIDDFLNDEIICGPIEVEIKKVESRHSKPKTPDKKPVDFWTIHVEDANSRAMKVNIWKEDYTRWSEELVVGNLVSMRVRPPSGGFSTMTFDSIKRGTKPPPKEEDYRIVVLERPERLEKTVDLDNFKFDLNAISGLEIPKPVEKIDLGDFQFDTDAIIGLEQL